MTCYNFYHRDILFSRTSFPEFSKNTLKFYFSDKTKVQAKQYNEEECIKQ